MLQHDAPFLSLQLPRYDVRVMLHIGDHHLVASLHLTFAERRGHQIDGLGCSACKHNLLRLLRIDEGAYLLTGSLVQIGCLLGEIVNATMHVGVHIQILLTHGIEHTQGLLRRCRIVQIDQRPTVNFPLKNGEIFSYLIDIVHYILGSIVLVQMVDCSFVTTFILPRERTTLTGRGLVA